jgi:hypothetical protein
MACHCEIIKEVSSSPLSELLKKLCYSSLDHPLVKYSLVDIRKDTTILHGNHLIFHRVFLCTRDSGEYVSVGWVLSQEIHRCMICADEFSSLHKQKHHCRACGNVVCHDCSPMEAVVDLIDGCEPVRVCNFCSFGQTPVKATVNHLLGESVLVEEDNKARSETGDGDEGVLTPSEATIEEKLLPFDYHSLKSTHPILKKHDDSPPITVKRPELLRADHNRQLKLRAQAIHSLEMLKKTIRLKDYDGFTELQEITPIYLMKAHYYYSPSHPHSTAATVSSLKEVKSSFLYVNLCACDSIPRHSHHHNGSDSSTVYERHSSSSASSRDSLTAEKCSKEEIFCLVFTRLTETYRNAPVMDCGMNSELIHDLFLLQEICVQVLVGLSIKFPDYCFEHYELIKEPGKDVLNPMEAIRRRQEEDQRHSRLRRKTTEKELVFYLPIPPIEAMKGLKYCFTSMNDSLMGEHWEEHGFAVALEGKSRETYFDHRKVVSASKKTSQKKKNDRRQREVQFQTVIQQFIQYFRIHEENLFLSSSHFSSLPVEPVKEQRKSFLSHLVELKKETQSDSDSERRSSPFVIPKEKLLELKESEEAFENNDHSQDVNSVNSKHNSASSSISNSSLTTHSTPSSISSRHFSIASGSSRRNDGIADVHSSDAHFFTLHRKEGGKLLSEDSMTFIPELTASHSITEQLKESAKRNASILLGWQIQILSSSSSSPHPHPPSSSLSSSHHPHKSNNSDSDGSEYESIQPGDFHFKL